MTLELQVKGGSAVPCIIQARYTYNKGYRRRKAFCTLEVSNLRTLPREINLMRIMDHHAVSS
jgi:hypothetical protein